MLEAINDTHFNEVDSYGYVRVTSKDKLTQEREAKLLSINMTEADLVRLREELDTLDAKIKEAGEIGYQTKAEKLEAIEKLDVAEQVQKAKL